MRTVFCFLGFVFFGLILFFILGDALVDRAWLSSLGEWTWIAAVGLMITDIFVPIPNTLIITLMGQIYGPILGGLIGTLGTFSAGVIAYGLTRMLGKRFASWLLGAERETAEKFFKRNGAFAVACSRWLPLLPEAISCLAGLARMPFGKYCLALLCGAVPMCFAYSALALVSENEIIPLIISILLPVPVWWVAARLLYLRRRSADYDSRAKQTK
jgi:uncharacterized membrane protein YdjX (TVP38/TMEM64 family)